MDENESAMARRPRKQAAPFGPERRRPFARAEVEGLESRLHLSVVRTINGRVYYDLHDKGRFLPKDKWMAGVQVFIDMNANGVLDAGEPSTVTNHLGVFSFRRLPRGIYDIVEIPPADDMPTVPANGMIVADVNKRSLLALRFGNLVKPPVPDTDAPAGVINAPTLATSGSTPYQFSVAWTDATAVNVSSFGNDNLVVTGPDGYNQPGTLVAVDSSSNGSPRTATYQVSAPGGGWNSNDDGTYTVTLLAGQVRDKIGNVDPSQSLGTFTVAIPSINPNAPALVGGTNGVTANNNQSPGSAISVNVSNTAPGATLVLMVDGNPIGSANATSTDTILTSNGASALPDGSHQFVVNEALSDGTQVDSAPSTVIVDTTGPTAALVASPLTAIGASTYQFTVTWTDATAVSANSVGGQDLLVTGTGGFSHAPTLLSLAPNLNGPTLVGTYQLTSPGATWTTANDGTYTVTLLPGTAEDVVNNDAAGGAIGTFTVAVGANASPSPQAPYLTATSDSGAFNNDSVTDLNNSSAGKALKIVVPGTDAGATVKIYAGAKLIASGVAGGSSITLTTNGNTKLPDGTNLLTATQTDPGAAPSAASPTTGILVDTQAPTATSAPASISAAGATTYSFPVVYKDNLAIDISHFATGDVVVSGPNGFSQTAIFNSVNAQGDGSPRTVTYSITPPGGSWTGADNGTYTITLQSGQVFDTAGNAGKAGALATFNVNTSLPSSPAPATPALLPASDTGISNGDGLTRLNNSSVPMRLQFSVGATVAGATITLYSDGTAIGSAVAAGTTTTVTTDGVTTLIDGPHTITARQTLPGHGQSSDSPGQTVTIDTAPPTSTALSAPTIGAADVGVTAYTFTITITDNQAVDVMSFGNANVTVGTPLGGTLNAVFVSANPNADGSPVVATYVITPPGGSWNSSDDGTYMVNLQSGEIGDTAGNTASAASAGSFIVNIPAPASPTPAIPALLASSDSGSSNSDGLTDRNNASSGTKLQFSIGATVTGASVTLYADGNVIGSAVAAGATTTVTSNGTLTLSDGAHTFTATQTAPGDSPSVASSGSIVTIDTAKPTGALSSAPSVTIAGATSYNLNVTYTDTQAIDVTKFGNSDITVLGPVGGTIGAIFVSATPNTDGSPVVATYAITPPGGSWSSGDNGLYAVTLHAGQVNDTAGNGVATTALGNFAVSIAITATPAAPVLSAASTTGSAANVTSLNNSSSGSALQFSVASTLSGATVTIYSDGTAIGSAVANSSTTTVTTDGSTILTNGPHSITARQQSPGLVQSIDSAPLTITINTALPTAVANVSDVNSSGASTYQFTVTYTDALAIDTTSVNGNSNAIVVTGPNGFNVPATFVSIDIATPGTPRTATYQFTAPNGAWDMSANGLYTVTLKSSEIFNTAGISALSAAVGTFNVSIPMGG